MTPLLRAAALLALGALAPWAVAQPAGLGGAPPPDPDDLVTWTVDPVRVAAGEAATLRLGLTVAPGWHVYALDSPTGIPLSVDLRALPAGTRVRAVRQSEPIETVDPSVGEPVRWFEDRATVEVDLAAAAAAAPGEHAATVAIRFGVCDDRICLPPQTRSLPVRVAVAPAAPVGPAPAPEASAPEPVAVPPAPAGPEAGGPVPVAPPLSPDAPAEPPAEKADGPWLVGLPLAVALAALLVWRRRRRTSLSS